MATGAVTVLMNSGLDAFTNLFDVELTLPSIIPSKYYPTSEDDHGYSYSVRAMGFQPPELSAVTYQSDYKAIQLTRQSSKIQGDRTFQIEFRLDSSYYLYYDLLAMKRIFVNPNGEGNIQPGMADVLANIATEGNNVTSSNKYGVIKVAAYSVTTPLNGYSDPIISDATASTAAKWIFYDVICNKVGTPNFQRAGTDAATVTAEFIFGRYSEPNYNLVEDGNASIPPFLTGQSA